MDSSFLVPCVRFQIAFKVITMKKDYVVSLNATSVKYRKYLPRALNLDIELDCYIVVQGIR